jgi:hypothetical protein
VIVTRDHSPFRGLGLFFSSTSGKPKAKNSAKNRFREADTFVSNLREGYNEVLTCVSS